MVNALRRLGSVEPGELPKALKAFGITEQVGPHRPPPAERVPGIEALG